MKEKYKQLSIYDFLNESQELPPSETVAKVDEAQEPILRNCKCVGVSPSSDLDTKPSPCCPNCREYRWTCDCEVYEPTEDTDLPLFSVGDVLTVRQASEVYSYQNENYDWIKTYEGKSAKVLSFDGKSYECEVIDTIKLILRFYPNELK